MKYLNDRITQRIDLGTTPAKGMYKYEVQVYDLGWNAIFVGNYYNYGTRYYTFDITDICRNRKSTLHTSGSSDYDNDVNIVQQYRIVVTKDNNGNTVTGTTFFVAHIYTYPNLQYGYDPGLSPDNVFFDINTNTKYNVSVLLQGSSRYRSPESSLPSMYLIPQYPNVGNSQDLTYYDTMTFGLTLESGSSIQNVIIFGVERGKDYSNQNNWLGQYDMNINMDSSTLSTTSTTSTMSNTGFLGNFEDITLSTTSTTSTMSNTGFLGNFEDITLSTTSTTSTMSNTGFLGNFEDTNPYTHTFFGSFGKFISDYDTNIPYYDIDVYITWKNGSNGMQYRKVAEIKSCKERYYLLWQDRYGSYQSQPFKGKMEYSEDFTNEEILSYTGRRRKSNVIIQPKWKLNSGWLKEQLFPFYESIYVSPILKLYDTKTQHEYDVILKDTPYVEKKYNNDRKLLSIELNLEATETQNIIY